MMMIGALLIFVAIIGIVLGLVKPSLVIMGNIRKSRSKVILIYGFISVIGIILGVIGAPSNFELGQTALTRQDYETAVEAFERLTTSDSHYAEAQPLLVDARKKLWSTRLNKAKVANSNKEYEKVVSLLVTYPTEEIGYLEAKALLDSATQTLKDVELAKIMKEKSEQQKETDRVAQANEEKQARQLANEQDKEMKRIVKAQEIAIAAYPECASSEAQIQVANAMENAPLGRVFGLSIVKIRNVQQVAVSPSSRNCRGNVQLSNAQTYPITYRFYSDGEDVFVESEIHGLGE